MPLMRRAFHEALPAGKLGVRLTKPFETPVDLSLAYSPGVAAPCLAIHEDPAAVHRYTGRSNLVAVVTNGSAVLGLGNLGPAAAKPVMEGKAALFKRFADIDAFDLELAAPRASDVVAACEMLEPTFGGINLEDIRAPECFEIEEALRERLSIPVLHDDQHGTAVIVGAGASAIACAHHLIRLGRTLEDALRGADAFIGLSVPRSVPAAWLAAMARDPVVFALANPEPDIAYDDIRRHRPDAIVATGRSDYPNQVNNLLGFPGIFRGALDSRARTITDGMLLAATEALQAVAHEAAPAAIRSLYPGEPLDFGAEYLIPKPFDPRVVVRVARAVAAAAAADGVAGIALDLPAYIRQLEHRLAVPEWGRGAGDSVLSRDAAGAWLHRCFGLAASARHQWRVH